MKFTKKEFERFYNPKLLKLWSKVDDCPFCRREKNGLNHILGGGQIENPEVMFVLINPTYRNISSSPNHFGPRTPFLGVSNFWRVLVESGFLDKEIYFSTEKRIWSKKDITKLLNHQREKNIYITNIVKCTGHNADLPSGEKINHHLKLLFEEINVVDPKTIITFGLIPFRALTGRNLKMSDHYRWMKSGNINLFETPEIGHKKYPVFPTYFPVGRGDFKKSVELLKIFKGRTKNGQPSISETKRDHIAIMKRSWGLIPKILDGTKTCESRWYKSKITPWDRIHSGDNLYFKDSGEPVTVKTKVTKVLQYEIKDNDHALEVIKKHAQKDLGLDTIPEEIENYILNKNHAIFVFFDSVEKTSPFEIDKSGFGAMAAWITVDNISKIAH